ncbi:hypothetical protein SAMN05443144_103198 [Fodinibius roseus]|uniref:Uncharacterized protein n=1 Tax=Fodinibius roseus TaxID=1194090 RepID=A0A1M4WEI1_9BACT|nr:hypothetical protein [Fodinibius roseus]SHE79560.1 hypothetical protein SAMN05443144_103198 [Fodinibius roseus]
MSSDSRSERERLKEEYKAHYRKMRASREHLSRAEKTRNITEALRNMDTSQMMESVDDFLDSLKHKLASVEARLDVAMDSLTLEEHLEETEKQLDEEMSRSRAKDTLRQLKTEMGLLYKEIEQQADHIQVEKTIGSGSAEEETDGEEPGSRPGSPDDKSQEDE